MAWGKGWGARASGAKFGSKRTPCPLNHPHPSALEASVCAMIGDWEKAGVIKLIQTQRKIYLSEARIGYIPDFYCMVVKTGQEIFIEAKGFETETWAIKLKLYRTFGPLELRIYKGTAQRPILDEVITPTYGKDSLMPEFVKDPPALES